MVFGLSQMSQKCHYLILMFLLEKKWKTNGSHLGWQCPSRGILGGGRWELPPPRIGWPPPRLSFLLTHYSSWMTSKCSNALDFPKFSLRKWLSLLATSPKQYIHSKNFYLYKDTPKSVIMNISFSNSLQLLNDFIMLQNVDVFPKFPLRERLALFVVSPKSFGRDHHPDKENVK